MSEIMDNWASVAKFRISSYFSQVTSIVKYFQKRQTNYRVRISSWIFELDFRVGFSIWIFELGFSSWIFELGFRVGFLSWIFELDFRVGFSS